MFKELKIKDGLQLFFIIGLAILFGYLYVNNHARNQIWQETYPLRATLANQQLTCSPNAPKWLATTLKYQTDNNNATANQIAYINNKGELAHCENGYQGKYPLLSEPVTAGTRFRYASVTKLWTSDVILDLIKQGKLSFETPIVSVLTEIKNPKDPRINQITIGDLLLHRGGFDRYTIINAQDMFGIGKDICPNHIPLMNELRLNFDPNRKMSYSNLGYCLLGEVASRMSQQSYIDLIKNNYNFTGTTLAFIDNKPMTDEVSYNYNENGLTGIADIFNAFDYRGLASVAGLSGNATDLAKQVHSMSQKPVPNILSLNPSLTCELNKLRDCYGYAMFPYKKDTQSPIIYYRDGGLLGLSSLVAVSDSNEVVALLSNGTPQDGEIGNDRVKMLIYQNLSVKK